MKEALVILIMVLGTTAAAADQSPPQSSAGSKIVTEAQVNGTWRSTNGEFKIWALGNQQLKVEFSGVYSYKSPQGSMANTGEGWGIAKIDGDTAIFKPEVSEPECAIMMKFIGGRLRVSQRGTCGFGFNVTADGTYRKLSRGKPKFQEHPDGD
jgi:hypothetical protein